MKHSIHYDKLWDAFKEGNKTAFGEIYQKYAALLLNYGSKINSDNSLIEDSIQAVETGTNIDLALEYINKIRDRVGHIPATTLTRELVRRERRVELAFEGLRYFDIMRWDLGPQVLNGPLYGSRLGTMDANGNVTWKGNGEIVNEENYIVLENRTFHPDRKYLFPIPLSEMDANPSMVQNPGY